MSVKLGLIGLAAIGALYRSDQPIPSNLCEIRSSQDVMNRIYSVLGATSRKLPKNFKGKFNVDGHTVVVFPSSSQKTARTHWRSYRKYKKKQISGRKYGLSRVFFLVGPGKLIPVGRITQSKFCRGLGGRRG